MLHLLTYTHMLSAYRFKPDKHGLWFLHMHTYYIYKLYLFYIWKDWSFQRNSSTVLLLLTILCSVLSLFKTFQGQHMVKPKALLNTTYRDKYTKINICIYNKLRIANATCGVVKETDFFFQVSYPDLIVMQLNCYSTSKMWVFHSSNQAFKAILIFTRWYHETVEYSWVHFP